MTRAWDARDWNGVLAVYAPGIRLEDRRPLLRSVGEPEGYFAQLRMLFDQPGSRWTQPLVATRGERLALFRVRFEATAQGGGGPLSFDEHLALVEVDAEGREIANTLFGLADEAAAYAELDARFRVDAREERARRVQDAWARAMNAHDWSAIEATMSPALRELDHRPLSPATGVDNVRDWLEFERVLVELAPDSRVRVEHVRHCERGSIAELVWFGTRDGGAYEMRFLAVVELNERGVYARSDVYEPEQHVQA